MDKVIHASEQGHWYWPDGRPAYEVPGANGQMVKPDIRHARKLRLCCGVTTIIKMKAEPNLEAYKRKQTLMAALTLTRKPDESDDTFIARIERDAEAHAKKRAEEGTRVHEAIERCLSGKPYDHKYQEHVSRVVHELDGFEGPFIADFKTKETLLDKNGNELPDKALFFDNHIMQLAAYRKGLSYTVHIPGKQRAANWQPYICETSFSDQKLFGGRVDVHSTHVTYDCKLISIMIGIKPAIVRVKIWTEEEAQRGWKMFEHCLELWKLTNRIEP